MTALKYAQIPVVTWKPSVLEKKLICPLARHRKEAVVILNV